MADYFTHFALKIPADRADAERFIKLLEATTAIEDGQVPRLAPELVAAFATPTQTSEAVLVEIFGDAAEFGIDCHFDDYGQTLTIFDRGGSPAIWVLAECLQRLFPEKLPLGFIYAETCSKPRPDGFGGGMLMISHDGVAHTTLDQLLEEALDEIKSLSDGG